MQVIINGESQEIVEGIALDALLAELAFDHRKVAVELNQMIVPKSSYGKTYPAAGDRMEIIGFIGGG